MVQCSSVINIIKALFFKIQKISSYLNFVEE
ncbi:hypothetical protein ACJIZ3_020851 [Penstemon smallii]|uniref:Uncharacterized protein n=1 Tax=Penstemon smallii TaxID=265156 RepID=A0ABD3SJS8_9LAMI